MKANKQFLGRSFQFWGYVRLISEKMGYSTRNESTVSKFLPNNIQNKLKEMDIFIDQDTLQDVTDYLNYRADILNNYVQHDLMNVDEARIIFNQLKQIHDNNGFTCKLPFNKQKEEKKDFAYFTCIINILTEDFLRNYANSKGLIYGEDIFFNDDPKALTYIKDSNNIIQGAFSRRYDGVYPSVVNPKGIWEIKEYYYTTTFGSRIADGVFEVQLDGYEFLETSHFMEGNSKHIFFIDAYYTWWVMGKSYLCRIIDMLHMGLVDDVIFGKEVIRSWHGILEEIV